MDWIKITNQTNKNEHIITKGLIFILDELDNATHIKLRAKVLNYIKKSKDGTIDNLMYSRLLDFINDDSNEILS